jgi:hypothetical protein
VFYSRSLWKILWITQRGKLTSELQLYSNSIGQPLCVLQVTCFHVVDVPSEKFTKVAAFALQVSQIKGFPQIRYRRGQSAAWIIARLLPPPRFLFIRFTRDKQPPFA